MPEARWEWVVFSVGIAVTVALVALILVGRDPKTPDSRSAALTRPATTATAPVTSTRPTTTRPATTTTSAPQTTTTAARPPTAATTTQATQPAVRLRLTARSDTWLSVRRAGGAVLYQGTLPGGESKTFAGERFEVRFGAAANVQATLNGKSLSLPGGTYSVTVGESGLGPRSA
jgi:cytoskeletal protein RodZ